MSICKRLLVLAFCLPAPAAYAAGAFVVDDADIVTPNAIQTENWFSHSSKDENIVVDDIAYQLLPNAEFTLLNTYDGPAAGGGTDTVSAQVKYKWRDGDGGKNIASAAVLGINYGTDNRFAGMYAYIPSSWAINEIFDLNADLGWLYTASNNRHFVSWGLGTNLHASEVLSFTAEVFGDNFDKPGVQAGPRIGLSKTLELDIVYGRDITGANANWLTAGITATF